jgi:hypothetical protein
MEIGVVGNAVGASFAVLVAEQLHASGAALVISITSAGQLTSLARPPYFVLIRAAQAVDRWRKKNRNQRGEPEEGPGCGAS